MYTHFCKNHSSVMLYKVTLNDDMKYLQCRTPDAQMREQQNKLTTKWRMA